MNSKVIVVDKISFVIFFKLIKFRKCTIINFGDELSVFKKFFFIELFKLKIETPSFFWGDIKLEDNESLALKVRRITNELAIIFSEKMINGNHFLKTLNAEFGNKTFTLGFSRIIASELEQILNLLYLSRFLFSDVNFVFLLKRPRNFPEDYLMTKYNHDFVFYHNSILEMFEKIKIYNRKSVKDFLKSLIFLYKSKINIPVLKFDKTILTGFEDSLGIEIDLRNQLFWFNRDYGCNLVCFNNSFFGTRKFRISKKLPSNFRLVSFFEYVYFSRINSNDCAFNNTKNAIKEIDNLIIEYKNSSYYYIYVYIRDLLKESIEMGSLVLSTNSISIVSKEVQNTYFDAVQLCPNSIKPITIGLQYSNMPMFSPYMSSTCDYFLIFAKFYEKLFKYSDYGPKKFVESGYIFNSTIPYTKKRAHRYVYNNPRLENKIVVGFFDESVQHSKWGFISEKNYLTDVILLAEFVINNPNIVVIFKTQFMSNLPSVKYSDNIILREAINSGRFIDYFEGLHRNEIYPSEVAHLSNICISNKIGATAGLESYIAGCNTVLIDSLGLKCEQDVFYIQEPNLQFSSLESFLIAFETSNFDYKKFGDWSSFIQEFDAGSNCQSEIMNLI